ncbi:MAG: MaoC family dehydratase [Aestuariivirga sp.]
MGLWLDEIEDGHVVELGSFTFTRETVLDYARKFDPQPFHVDDEAAAKGPFGKLAASGWHTAAAWMKCYVATNQREAAARDNPAPSGPSPGFTNLKWLKPVFPGDTIHYRSTVTGKRELASRPEWGLVFSRNEGFNQQGELVFSFDGKVLTARRPAQ